MASVADLVDEESLRRLAAPGTIVEGRAIAEHGAVQLDEFGPLGVTARVAEKQTVELLAKGDALSWRCTCPAGTGSDLCEHAVAVALEAWRRAPKRRG